MLDPAHGDPSVGRAGAEHVLRRASTRRYPRHSVTHDDAHLTTVLIYRCRGCGDVFPVHEDERPLCPSCAGDDVDLASEPLL